MKPYACPKCGETERLAVHVLTTANLVQHDDGSIETVWDGGDHEWDGTYTMWCAECGHADGASSFFRNVEERT